MKTYPTMRLIAAGAIICSATIFSSEQLHGATFLVSDVTTWLGIDPGANVSEAVLVIDWADGQAPWAWGYRWQNSELETGGDLLAALMAEELRFSILGLASGFVSGLAWDADLDGTPERFKGDFNPDTGEYWTYSVNNDQQTDNFTDGAAPVGAHILPPLGSPNDEDGPGAWVSSNTGVLGRPLVDGSWDGFLYAEFGSAGPAFAVNAPAVPETSMSILIGAGACLLSWKRRG
ncbi:MAG: hypothetical protein H7Y36_11335 [Armatimonadetes bacterium]|nr:hypothetical protein [Akkermansiaceae bacterium]